MNIEIKEISIQINETMILDKVSCDISNDEFTCLVGPNGSGKSTLVKSIVGEITDYQGDISNVDVTEICYLPQDIEDPPFLTVKEICKLGFYKNSNEVDKDVFLDSLLDTCGISSISKSSFTDISTGEKQRTWLAFALAQGKDLIIMDEPLSSIDSDSRETFYSLLRDICDMGKTLLVITHDIDMARKYSDSLIVLSEGRVSFSGPTTELTKNKMNKLVD
ncbi:MAG: ATP-binding cassette domain-containing protein [Chloroflexota bacterium]|jgi:ABC-type Mn2+/Zn2+ transport system ATPase subunit|tara:strand:+ start:3229 stop:3888 length:660 start_codon:yes stop_codon:yes gene_type:complete